MFGDVDRLSRKRGQVVCGDGRAVVREQIEHAEGVDREHRNRARTRQVLRVVREGVGRKSGEVDIVDVTFLQRFVIKAFSLNARGLKASDVLRDGEPDAVDATQIQRYVVRAVSEL